MNALWTIAHDLEAAAVEAERNSLVSLGARLRRAYIAVGETAAKLETTERPGRESQALRNKEGENTNTMLPLDQKNNSRMPYPLRTHDTNDARPEVN